MKDREVKKKENEKKYVLPKGFTDELILKSQPINNLLSMDQIMNPKNNFSTIEKLHHLRQLEEAV